MIHVFPYSKRQGTVAATMSGQLPEVVKHERVKSLSALQGHVQESLLRTYVGKTVDVLFETYENGIAFGHTDHFIEVACHADHALHAKTIPVLITGVDAGHCIGTPMISTKLI